MRVKAAFPFLFAVVLGVAQTNGVDVQDIIKKSVAATLANWKEAPKYGFIERDVESRKDSPKTVKSYQVLMIEGSPYNKLTAVNDRPLSKAEEQAEQQKLQAAIWNRQHERPHERARRVNAYGKERDHDHAMMQEMAAAFNFKLVGETKLDGHDVFEFAATAKPGYVPPNRDAKVLTGMKGKLWIDKATYQWVKVEAEVLRPVNFYGFLAKVGPGTRFELEQEPVAGSLWLPKHFASRVYATALGFINENSIDDETYRDYQLLNTQASVTSLHR